MVAKGKKIENNYNSKTTDDQQEFLIEVTQDDKTIGKIRREECHNESKKPWHRTTHTYLFTPDGNIILGRRSNTKDTGAGGWSSSVAGHVNWGESYDEAAKIELGEELGLKIRLTRIDKIAVDFGSEREFIAIYVGVTEKINSILASELMDVKTFDYKDIVKRFKKGTFDLSGGSRDSFKYLIETGILDEWHKKLIRK